MDTCGSRAHGRWPRALASSKAHRNGAWKKQKPPVGLSGCTVGWVGAEVQGKPEAGSPCAQPPSWVPEGCGSFGHLYLFDHTHQGHPCPAQSSISFPVVFEMPTARHAAHSLNKWVVCCVPGSGLDAGGAADDQTARVPTLVEPAPHFVLLWVSPRPLPA